VCLFSSNYSKSKSRKGSEGKLKPTIYPGLKLKHYDKEKNANVDNQIVEITISLCDSLNFRLDFMIS